MMRLTTTVGFEYEFSGSTMTRVEQALRDKNVHCTRPAGWHRSDGSIWDLKTDSTCGWEVASPVLETYEQLVDAAHVGALIAGAGGSVNDSCGFHVHIGIGSMTPVQIENIFRFMTRYEAAFFLLVPPVRRRSSWCKNLSEDQVRKIKRANVTNREWWNMTWADKNVWLNGRRYPEIKTLEFRIMPGTLNPNFIIGYVTFLLCMINTVKDRKISWGTAKGKDNRSMFQTMLGQAGFYGPFTTPEQKELYVTGRKWALERYSISETMDTFALIPRDYRVSRVEIKIPSVSIRPSWSQPQADKPRRRRSPRATPAMSESVTTATTIVTAQTTSQTDFVTGQTDSNTTMGDLWAVDEVIGTTNNTTLV